MKLLGTCLLLGACTGAFALDNSVTIYEASGSTQNDRPITLGRVFAQGDIPNCPQAYRDGAPLITQADIRTRWSDGSVQYAVLTYKSTLDANAPAIIHFRDEAAGTSCAGTGYLTFEQISAAAWDGQIELTANNRTITWNAKTMLSRLGSISQSLESLGARYLLKGPLVTEILIEDRDPDSRQFCDGWEWDWSTNNWKEPASSNTKSLCPMFIVTLYPNTPSQDQYSVRVQSMVSNTWTDRLQAQIYGVTVKFGSPLTVHTATTADVRHLAKSDWRIAGWSTNQPGAIQIDWNFRYMIYSKIIPQYDLSIRPNLATLNNELNSYYVTRLTNGYPSTIPSFPSADNYAYLWTKAIGTAGGRKDMGIFNQTAVSYLYAMGNTGVATSIRQRMYDRFIIANAEAMSGLPVSYQEAKTDRCFDRPDGDKSGKFFNSGNCASNAKGKPLSITARPTAYLYVGGLSNGYTNNENSFVSATENDRIEPYVCPAKSFKATSGNPVLVSPGHGMQNGQIVRIKIGPGALNSEVTRYYVVDAGPDTFSLAANAGGLAITPSSSVPSTTLPDGVLYPFDCQIPVSSSVNPGSNRFSWEGGTALGHWYSPWSIAYILSGDYWFLMKQQYESSYLLAHGSGATVTSNNGENFRSGATGYIYETGSQRASAWAIRTLADAAFYSIDGTPEKSFYTQKLMNNVAAREGLVNLTMQKGGYFQHDPVRGSMWLDGHNVWAKGADNSGLPLHDIYRAVCTTGTGINEGLKNQNCIGRTGFIENYIRIEWNHLAEMFPFAVPTAKEFMKAASLEMTTNDGPLAGWSPYMVSEYHIAASVPKPFSKFAALTEAGDTFTRTFILAATIDSTQLTIPITSPNTPLDWMNGRAGRVLLIDNEYVRVGPAWSANCFSQPNLCPYQLTLSARGIRDSTPSTHLAGAIVQTVYDEWDFGTGDPVHGYPFIYVSALAGEYLLGSAMPGWTALSSIMPSQSGMATTQGWALRPRDMVHDLSARGESTSAVITYTVPQNGSCGKYRISTSAIAGGDSSDADDTPVEGQGACTLSLGDLTPGVLYYYRLSSVGNYSSGRVFGAFTTTAP